MSRASLVARGRAAAERGMDATCLITADGVGDPVFDDETGQYTDPARATIYEGVCRIQIPSIIAGEKVLSAGERATTTQEAELQLPVGGTDGVAIDHRVEILTSPLDVSLVGRVFTVTARHEKSHATARRLRVRDVTG